MRSRRRSRTAPTPPHRCDDCRRFGGFVQTTDAQGRPSFKPCPKGIPPPTAPPVTVDVARRVAGDRDD